MHAPHRQLRPTCLVLLLSNLLLGSAAAQAAPPASFQAVRFAVEGRAKVSNLPLACGRNAESTIVALCKLASSTTGQAVNSNLAAPRVQETSGLDAPLLKTMEIPDAARGFLRVRLETDDPMIRESVAQGTAFLTRVVAKKWLPTSVIRVRSLGPTETRAYSVGLGGDAFIYLPLNTLDPDTAIHELSHHIEGDHRMILGVSKRFLARRAKGGRPESLSEIIDPSYGKDEIAFRANWATRGGHPYIGKFYGPSLKEAFATELISMGLERLHREPAAFFQKDSDYFLFLLLVLQVG